MQTLEMAKLVDFDRINKGNKNFIARFVFFLDSLNT